MSTKHVRTTGDLIRFGLKLTIECGRCGSSNIRTGAEVIQTVGLTSLAALQRRLRCEQCGKRAAKLRYLD